MKQKKLVLIDGFSYLYRAYYAFPNLKDKEGQFIGAQYGMTKMMKKIFSQDYVKYASIIFDARGKNFRHNLFKQYKRNRNPMPENLKTQIYPILNTIKNFGIPIIIKKGVEADDVIGTIAKKAEKEKWKILICTNDKDFIQLISKNIFITNRNLDEILGIEEVLQKFGIHPNLFVDYIALVGDRADNIPGVPGIGKVTAVKLLSRIGNLKKIYYKIKNLEKNKIVDLKKIFLILKEYKKTAFLSYKLAKIRTNLDLKVNLKNFFLNKKEILKNIKSAEKILNLKNFF
ncbi:5'-3' exonuclease [bacterium endosymbiont of Pedicinus badii]|uniref:5'-3' exonuclease n=1 Tax=bacterium endosymbiont of Pedicinus badii TaxID=1719126 RepID=UPI0009BBD291|nr:5'-3' exonuclease H3TH domain-containing protein [bacterium endosymbiont of Pedicinus badii]OQM34064.1 hypothetical protein AOQ89_01760 [bacterium endosymbiont of Pedicinus badii]